MTFITDHHFHIGADHLVQGKPCQDFALSGVAEDTAYAVVSDGCSTGGMTDVGSRLLALTTATAIRTYKSERTDVDPKKFTQYVGIHQQITTRELHATLGLTVNDLLATCLYGVLGRDSGLVHVQGDGVVALVDTNGGIVLHRYDWDNSTPYYPAYRHDRLESFANAHGGWDTPALRQTTWACSPDGTVTTAERTFTVTEGIEGITLSIDPLEGAGLAYVALFSDGVTQVDGLDWTEAATQLLSFKSPVGAFAKRRMIRFLKDVREKGRGPLDDIAYAVIHPVAAPQE